MTETVTQNKFKVGDRIRANELSNISYRVTNLNNGCEGIVVGIVSENVIKVRVTKINADPYWKTLTLVALSSNFDLIKEGE